MKKIITLFTACLLMSATVAAADPYWHEHHEYREHREHHGRDWVAPLLGGIVVGAVVGELAREHHEHHEQYRTIPYRTITVAREHYNEYYRPQPVYSCTGWQLQYDRFGDQEYVRTCYEQ
jgi:hypothetical protein